MTFHRANFAYPSRENIKVLRSMNLKINQGQTIAIVGQSGQGKSTMIQFWFLIIEFYHDDCLRKAKNNEPKIS